MPLLSASEFAQLLLPGACELQRGRLHRLPPPPAEHARGAARVARLLAPAAADLGGYVSTELVVRLAANPDSAARPDACVVLADPPVDGVVDVAPDLVVAFAPIGDVGRWLRGGARAVWVVGRTGAALCAPGRPAVRLDLDATLTVPGLPTLRLAVAAACGLRPAVAGVGG